MQKDANLGIFIYFFGEFLKINTFLGGFIIKKQSI
jgi:hypothetical protein